MFDHLEDDIDGILRQFKQALDNEDKRVALMKSINANPDQLKYTPPETKGSIIFQLMDVNALDVIDQRNQKKDTSKWGVMQLRKTAIMLCFKWVQSKADYNNVMQHMTARPAAGKGNIKANEQALLNFLGTTEFGFMGNFSTQYQQNLQTLYERLPDTVVPDEPFKPIPHDEMERYIALINNNHNSTTQMA
ncbi:Uncharacterised protein [Pseudescherichia vulneris]|nr:Uncharacterised protein [Pseudescherichia vulneris]